MDDRPRIKAHDAADLIRLLPLHFGFTPRESICAIATYGDRCRMGFSLRLDLPAPGLRDPVARRIVELLARHGADGAIVVAVSQDTLAGELTSRAVLAALVAEGDVEPVVIAWGDDTTVWSTVEPDGVEYETGSAHPGVIAAMVDGREIVDRREDLESRVLPATGPRRAWFDATWPRVLAQLAASCPPGAEDPWARLLPRLDQVVDQAPSATDGDVLLAGAAVQALCVRDHVWERLTASTDPAAGPFAELAFWQRVARSVPGPLAAPPLCLAAIAAHRLGEGALMSIALDRAREVEPLYPLTGLLTGLIERGIGPQEMDRAMDRLTTQRQGVVERSTPHPLDLLRDHLAAVPATGRRRPVPAALPPVRGHRSSVA